jgi:LysR family transcriptional regulator for metE and metH
LGVSLFARVRRRLVPTPAGTRLLDESRVILNELARVERDLYRGASPRREVVRIVVETFTSYHWLPEVARALSKEAPHVEVRIVLAAAREPAAALLRGVVDVAIVAAPVSDRSLVTTPLFRDTWTVLAPPKHRFANAPYVTAKALAEETVYAHEGTRHDVERLRDRVAAERAPLPRVVSLPITDALVDMVAAGLGVGLVSRWAVMPRIARGDVVARKFTREGSPKSGWRWCGAIRAHPRRPHASWSSRARSAWLRRDHFGMGHLASFAATCAAGSSSLPSCVARESVRSSCPWTARSLARFGHVGLTPMRS